MGLIWAMATAREASISRSPRKSSTTEQPISSPEPTGARDTGKGTPAGRPRMVSRMLPYSIPEMPHQKHRGGTPWK